MIERQHERGRLRFLRCTVRQCVILLTLFCVLAAMTAPLFQPDAESKMHAASRRLLIAAQKGDLTAVAKAIAAGADIRAWDANGDTAMSFAFKAKNLALVQLLVEEGLSLDTAFKSSEEFVTPLSFAVRKDDRKLTRFLLDAGANPNPSDRHRCLHYCVANANLEMMELLFERGTDAKIDNNREGSSLRDVFESSHPPEIRYALMEKLLEYGADVDAVGDGLSAMDLAVQHNDAQACDLLRRHGAFYTGREATFFNRFADVQRMVAESPHVLTEHYSLSSYVQHGTGATVYYVRPGTGATMLGIALERSYEELAIWLLSAGASVNSIELDGGTTLHSAARGGHPQLVKLLLDRKLEVEARDESQRTPLHVAVSSGRDNVVIELLDAGADVNALYGYAGWTPLHEATYWGNLQLVQRLLAAGADPTIADTRDGATPYDLARRSGNLELQKLLGHGAARMSHSE
ncbi:MAG: ankyrin repeat domain-containing protein [Planctomycetia bacterium]|nr:ankyrin repeat domain-containing protein [Planctomycetia bacterium]